MVDHTERRATERQAVDLLALVSVGAIAAFVTLLCVAAARHPDARGLITPVVVGLGAGGLILFRQLRKAASTLSASEARAKHAATHDPVTTLPNLTLFCDRLAERTTRQGQASVFCVGIDRFDELIEFRGVSAANGVVVDVAARLSEICGPDAVLARLEAGVFGLVRSDETRSTPLVFANSLIAHLAAARAPGTDLAYVGCSVGVGFADDARDSDGEALRQAQIALSHARRLGGEQAALFQPEMDHSLRRRKTLEADLRRALASEELAVVYQPQVSAKGALVGVEALVRWVSPQHGEVPPSIFVPLAEDCGLCDALGRFTLRRALRDAASWPGLCVAINVAAPQIRSGGLVGVLRDLLAQNDRGAQGIELEITESVLLADEPEILQTLEAVRRMGFSIALDDFGTGYSSLSYLRRFPIDKIKIDQSFIAQLGRRPESSAIVKAIVELAEALDLKVLAEGVETRDQVERLARIGCVLYQGYFFSKPVEASKIAQMAARRAALAA